MIQPALISQSRGARLCDGSWAACLTALLVGISTGCNKGSPTTSPAATEAHLGESGGKAPAADSKPVELPVGDPGNLAESDLKAIVVDVPAGLRKDRTDLQVARELGTAGWVVDYAGGPFACWMDVEETGQNTSPPRLPGEKGIDWLAQAESGQIVFCFRPGASAHNMSARSQRIVALLGPGESVDQVVSFSGVVSSRKTAGNPLMPLWWSAWDDVSLQESRAASKTIAAGQTVALLIVEASEKNPPAGAQPRKVKLTLMGRSAKPGNP
jgi:hypothetical protein